MTDGTTESSFFKQQQVSQSLEPIGEAMEVQPRILFPSTQPILEPELFDETNGTTVLSTRVENPVSTNHGEQRATTGASVAAEQLSHGDNGSPAVLLRLASSHPGYANSAAATVGGNNVQPDKGVTNTTVDSKSNRVLSGAPTGKGSAVEKKRPREDEDLATVSHLYTPIYYDDGKFNFSNPDGIVAIARPLFQEYRTGQIDGPVKPFPTSGPMGGPVRLRVTEVRWALEEEKQFGGRGSKPRIAYDLLSMGSTTVTDKKGNGELVSKLWIPPRRKQEKGETITH